MGPRGAAVVVAAAVLLLAGCGSASTADPESTSTPAPSSTTTTEDDVAEPVEGVDLEVTGRQEPEPAVGTGQPPVTRVIGAASGLLVRYTVRNTRDAPVLVVDRLPARGETMRLEDAPDPLRAVLRVGPGKQLDIVKAAGSSTAGLDYTPRVQASVVAPGAVHTGRAFVPFPADQYDRPDPFPATATTWRLCLGVLTDAGSASGRSADGRVALVAGGDAQALVCSSPAPLPDDWT